MADDFVRVRLSRIEDVDLNFFEFDLDLTMMIFFLSPEGKIYARYGGRDGEDADNRQSLEGLRYTMESVLDMHRSKDRLFAEAKSKRSLYVRDLGRRGRGCVHCHNAKELMNRQLVNQKAWSSDLVWRYPLPDNLGLILDVDRGNIVSKVQPKSAADKAGLQTGDQITLLNKVPIHSIGDTQVGLDRAPIKGTVDISWRRGPEQMSSKLMLTEGWRRSDITWRRSVDNYVPSLHLYGEELNSAEKKSIGLGPTQTAFWQQQGIHSHAKKSGFAPGDVILGINGKRFDLSVIGFLLHIRKNYVVGERIQVDIIRGTERMSVPMTLIR